MTRKTLNPNTTLRHAENVATALEDLAKATRSVVRVVRELMPEARTIDLGKEERR